jgi:hypothetical protein
LLHLAFKAGRDYSYFVKKRGLKIAIGVVLAVCVLGTGVLLYVSSELFVRTQILPRAAKSIGCDIHAAEIDFSPFSSIEFRNLRIGSETDPLMKAGTIRVRYRALSFLSGKIFVDEILLDRIRVSMTPEKIEVLSKSRPPSEKEPGKPSEPKKMPELLLKNVRINDLDLIYSQTGDDPVELQLLNLSLDLPELAGGSDFHLSVAAQAKAAAGEQVDAEIKEIHLDIDGTLGPDTMPTALALKSDVKGIAGTIGPVALDSRRVQVAVQVTGDPAAYELQEFSVMESIGEIKDAALEANGSLAINPFSAELALSLDIAPNSLLNVIGTLLGDLDFDQTAVTYSGHLNLTAGKRLATRGELQVENLTVAAPGIPALRPMQISIQHDLDVDLAGRAIALSRLDAKVSDRSRDVVTLELDRPVMMDLQNPDNDATAAISVLIDRLDLTLLNAFLAERPDVRILSGELSRIVTMNIESGGRRIAFDVGGGGIDKLLVQQGSRRIGPLRINHEARMQLTDFNALNIEHFEVALIPLSAGPVPAVTAVLDGSLSLDEHREGVLSIKLDGRGEKLAVLAAPFLDERSAEALHPVLLENAGLHLDSQLHAALTNGIIQLNESYIRVHGFGQDRLVDVALEETSFALEAVKGNPEKLQLPLRFIVNDLPLARLVLFLPAKAGIAKLGGTLNLDGRALLTGPTKRMNLETSARVENAMFMLRDGTVLSSPITPSLDLVCDYDIGGTVRIDRLNSVLSQAGGGTPLLDVSVSGHFDTGMDPAVRNVIEISTRGPVMLDALGKLVVSPEKRDQPTPKSVSEAAVRTASPPNLWMAISVAVSEAVYGDLRIQNAGIDAEYRGGKLNLSKAGAQVNDGTVAAEGVCDFSNPGKPKYEFRASGQNLQFAPVFASFIPRMDIHTRGAAETADILLRGEGFDMASMQENLEAHVNVQLGELAIERMSGTFGKLTEALLLGIFHLNWSDLSFMAGGLDLAIDRSRFGDHDIHIQTLLLQAPSFQLDGGGTVEFGGAWEPDVEIETGFAEAKANSLRQRGYAISAQADDAGYYPGPIISLKGDLSSLRTQASLVTELLVRSGKLSRQDAMRADLMNRILGSLGGTQAEGEEKADFGEIVGGILGGVLESQSPQYNQSEENRDPGKAFESLIKGVFGN